MAITNETRKIQYAIGGTPATEYPIPFPYAQTVHVKAVLRDSSGVDTMLVEGSGYSLSVPGASGVLTRIGTWPAAIRLTVYREVPLTQEVDVRNGDKLDAETLEAMVDKVTQIEQQLSETVGRQVLIPITDDEDVSVSFPSAEARAGKFLGFDAAGQAIPSVGIPTFPASGFMNNMLGIQARLAFQIYAGMLPESCGWEIPPESKEAIKYGMRAHDISYSPADSHLLATNTQHAIDEIEARTDAVESRTATIEAIDAGEVLDAGDYRLQFASPESLTTPTAFQKIVFSPKYNRYYAIPVEASTCLYYSDDLVVWVQSIISIAPVAVYDIVVTNNGAVAHSSSEVYVLSTATTFSPVAVTSGPWKIEYTSAGGANGAGMLLRVRANGTGTTCFVSSDGGYGWATKTISATARAWMVAGFAPNGTRMVIATYGSNYRAYSDNNGDTWSEGTISATAREWTCMVANKSTGNLVLAAGSGQFIATSSDNGNTWSELSVFPSSKYVAEMVWLKKAALVVAITSHTGLYQSSDDAIFSAYPQLDNADCHHASWREDAGELYATGGSNTTVKRIRLNSDGVVVVNKGGAGVVKKGTRGDGAIVYELFDGARLVVNGTAVAYEAP